RPHLDAPGADRALAPALRAGGAHPRRAAARRGQTRPLGSPRLRLPRPAARGRSWTSQPMTTQPRPIVQPLPATDAPPVMTRAPVNPYGAPPATGRARKAVASWLIVFALACAWDRAVWLIVTRGDGSILQPLESLIHW